MKQSFFRIASISFISGLILACSLTIPTASPTEPGAEPQYRYDDLPSESNQSAAFSEYTAISKWDKLDINYFFENGTDKLEEIEKTNWSDRHSICGQSKRH